MNRIEKIKGIVFKAQMEKGEPSKYARQICQLFPKPLPDEALREKARLTDDEIARALEGLTMFKGYNLTDAITPSDRAIADASTDKALTLLQQEEIPV